MYILLIAKGLNAKCHRLQLERLKKQLEDIQQVADTEKHPEVDAVPASPSNLLTESGHSDRSPTPLSPPLLSAGSSPLGSGSHSDINQLSSVITPALSYSPAVSSNLLCLDMDIEGGLQFDNMSDKEVSGGITNIPLGGDSIRIEKDTGGRKWIPYGSSLLHIAAEYGHGEVLRLLLAYGEIDINGRNMHGHTPLQLGVLTGKVEIVQLLLDHGADMTL
jgi:hypothetical protein